MKQKQLRLKLFKSLRNDLMSIYDQGNIEDGGIGGGNEAIDNIIKLLEKNCYAVYMSSGSWDDAYSWVEYICFDEHEAVDYITKYNERLEKLKNKVWLLAPKEDDGEANLDIIDNPMRFLKIMERNEAYVKKIKFL